MHQVFTTFAGWWDELAFAELSSAIVRLATFAQVSSRSRDLVQGRSPYFLRTSSVCERAVIDCRSVPTCGRPCHWTRSSEIVWNIVMV
jgi:hypothetical protein